MFNIISSDFLRGHSVFFKDFFLSCFDILISCRRLCIDIKECVQEKQPGLINNDLFTSEVTKVLHTREV